jgi:general secretion pathway protein E
MAEATPKRNPADEATVDPFAWVKERLQGKSSDDLLRELHSIATELGISDLHFSPQKENVLLQWTHDGALRTVTSLTHREHQDVLLRVKFISHLRLNVQNTPQDGQYAFTHQKTSVTPPRLYEVKVRVSTLPSKYGESLVLRLLDPERGIRPLSDLGCPKEVESALREAVHSPYGILLVTGPTGSGKTTTLYALLHTILNTGRKIMTLEDPVEYELPGIIQSQIDHEVGYTFALGLRAVMRQAPNVILIGEIRDEETAKIAAEAALTGHLVLATLHTNTAIESISRLIDMGVNTYALAPAIRGILAQRLARKLCPACRGKAENCKECFATGYKGRISLPEFLPITKEMRNLILSGARQQEFEEQAKKEEFRTMKDWGQKLIKQGITDEKEVARVTM